MPSSNRSPSEAATDAGWLCRGGCKGAGVPNREEIVHRALARLGCVSDEELVAFVAREFGVSVEARFVPVFRALLRAKEIVERARAKAREAADAGKADKGEGDLRPGESTSRSV